jgi:hypothetical protein
VLTYANEKPFREILQDITRFAGLITLCAYEHSYATDIVFFNEKIPDEAVLQSLQLERPQAIQYIYKNAFYKAESAKTNVHHRLIDAARIRESFSAVIKNWFTLYSKLEMFFQLILRAFVNKYDWSTAKFLDAARAIESFHRMNYSNRIFTKAEIKLIREQAKILDLPENYKKMPRGYADRLSYSELLVIC